MLINLYSIRDIKTDLFEAPYASVNDATAKRYFQRIAQQIPTIQQNPSDFTLHHVGYFNDANGEIDKLITVQYITSGLDCLKSNQQEEPDAPQTESEISDDSPIQSSTES